MAGFSLGLGLSAYILSFYGLAIPAVICGHIHLSKSRAGIDHGRGFSIAGLVLGYVAFAMYLAGAIQS
jgi:hypothetical protein